MWLLSYCAKSICGLGKFDFGSLFKKLKISCDLLILVVLLAEQHLQALSGIIFLRFLRIYNLGQLDLTDECEERFLELVVLCSRDRASPLSTRDNAPL
jgi:hypothetical protein